MPKFKIIQLLERVRWSGDYGVHTLDSRTEKIKESVLQVLSAHELRVWRNFPALKGKSNGSVLSRRVSASAPNWVYDSKVIFSSIIENPWAKSKRHISKPGLHIFSETNKLQQALVNFPWSNHPKGRVNTDKHPLSVSREHPCKYITCSYAVKDDWMMLTLG